MQGARCKLRKNGFDESNPLHFRNDRQDACPTKDSLQAFRGQVFTFDISWMLPYSILTYVKCEDLTPYFLVGDFSFSWSIF